MLLVELPVSVVKNYRFRNMSNLNNNLLYGKLDNLGSIGNFVPA
jgi:hypothetical protein